MANHSSTKTLSDLKRQFHKEELQALRYRKKGDIMNYLRKLKEAKRLRTEFHLLEEAGKTVPKKAEILEEELEEEFA